MIGLATLGLGMGVTVMFAAYFVSNHDLHYIAEDYLGITTKLAELAIIILLKKEWNQEKKDLLRLKACHIPCSGIDKSDV